MKVIHLSPHPDDESIACPAILLALVKEGHQVINLACSLGSKGQEKRRRELERATEILGLELIIDPVDLYRDQKDLLEMVKKYVKDADLIIAPSPHDAHPAHEIVGRVAVEVLTDNQTLWLWGLWADLPFPNLIYPFNKIDQVIEALAAHRGEIARNDYRDLVIGRAQMNKVLGPERVFGFGSKGIEEKYAELITEIKKDQDKFFLTKPHFLNLHSPLTDQVIDKEITFWLNEKALRDLLG